MPGDDFNKPQMESAKAPTYTAANGCPMRPPQSNAAIGKDVLMTDRHMIEMLSHFNREKIPERIVHANGAGAYGEFEVTEDVSDICNIDMLLGVGKKTPCVTRFSTTALEKGSADMMRDFKGMATKFYTEQGNWDWVCLNFPLFFIRDPIKFPSLMHAQRRDPRTNRMNPDMFWDWVTCNHESLHMILVQFSDFGTMFNWRGMSGYVNHAYKWVMPDGSFKYVHMFLSSDTGPTFFEGNRAPNPRDLDPDAATQDLYEAIERGENPSWTANIQVIDPKDAADVGFNILDPTKHWNLGTYPKDLPTIPAKPFGKLTLFRNPDNYFAEIEQLAFSPSNLVPGVEPSEDPLLQARMFAYPDAQRYRLGVNHQNIPVNRSHNTHNPLLRDGAGTFDKNHGSLPGYMTGEPSMAFQESSEPDPKYNQWLGKISSREWAQTNDDDYKFPREFFNIIPELRGQEFQDRLVESLGVSVSQTKKEIRERVYATFHLVLPELGDRVREATERILAEKGSPVQKL
ncbi:hypothetical protein N7507_001801 [Penicillium longicatenatum]|nr:hypothetical protein N7507_001801 [Penicillium longicatenatum]